jgi:hypothetical protein
MTAREAGLSTPPHHLAETQFLKLGTHAPPVLEKARNWKFESTSLQEGVSDELCGP